MILLTGLLIFISNFNIVFADEMQNLNVDLSNVKEGDSFKTNENIEYTVTQVDKSNISINNQSINIYNFEISANIDGSDTWRKFVKLEDICKDKNVCELLDDDTDIILKRTSTLSGKVLDENSKELDVYYRTVYYNSKKQFKSTMAIGEQFYNFNYDNSDDGKFDKNGILTTDVETLIDKNEDIYVSLRFVTEALGAEVTWIAEKKDGENDTVNINFYDDTSYCKNISTSFENACKNISDDELEKVKKCDDGDSECLDERCKTYISENIEDKKLDDLSIEIDYKYNDKNDKLKTFKANWDKNNIYFSSDKNVKKYGIVLYNSVPLLIDIFNGVKDERCEDSSIDDKEKCLADGNRWVTDEEMIELNGDGNPYCAIDLSEQITTSASR